MTLGVLSRRRRGVTIIESLAAAALLVIGVSSSIAAIGRMIRTEVDVREREKIQRMASDIYDEIYGTGDYAQAPLNGTFEDRGEPDYTWSASVEPSGVENLLTMTVTVSNTRDTKLDTTVTGLIYQAPTETTGAGGGQ